MAGAGSAIPFFFFFFALLFCVGYIGVNCHKRGVDKGGSKVFQRFQQCFSAYISQPWNSVNGQSINLGSGYHGSGHDEQSRGYIGSTHSARSNDVRALEN